MLITTDTKHRERSGKALLSPRRSLVALGAAATLVLAGCAGAADDTADTSTTTTESDSELTTIKLLHWEVGGPEFWAASIAAFEEANPTIKVEAEVVPFDRYNEVQGPYIASGSGPDVMANNAGFELFDRRTAYVEIPDDVRAVGDELLTYAGTCLEFDVNQACYGLPFSYQGNIMYYNKQVLTEAGLDPENPPATIDEFADACEAIQGIGKTCQALGLTGVFPAYWNFPEVARSFLTEDDIRNVLRGDLPWTDPKMVSVLEGLASITSSGWVNESAPSISMLPDGADIFQSGEAGFAATIMSDAVNWKAFGEVLGDENLGAMLYPALDPAAPLAGKFSGIEGSVYGVTTWSQNQEAAFELVKWIGGATHGQLWAELVGGQPLNTNVDTSVLPDSPALMQIQEIISNPTLHVGVLLSSQEADALARGWQQVALDQLTVDEWVQEMQLALEASPGKN